MKRELIILFTVFIITVAFLGCNSGSGSSKEEVNFSKDASYALGLNVGSGLRDGLLTDEIFPNINEFMKGMKDGMTGKEPRFDIFEARYIIESAFEAIMQERGAEALIAETAFLAENARNPGVIITPSGLQYEVLIEGTGPKPTYESIVEVHYEGRLTDGTLFDNSYERQESVTFRLSEVVTGWSEGLQLMSVGSKYRLFIPSEMGYGDYGYGPIPPYATLIFVVELISIL